MLALRMGRTIGELMATMSSQEFSIWIELYKEDRWGEDLLDLRAGVISATVANYAGKVRKGNSAQAVAADFFPSLADAQEVAKEPDPLTFFAAVAASKSFNK